jgi:hypothetical protein
LLSAVNKQVFPLLPLPERALGVFFCRDVRKCPHLLLRQLCTLWTFVQELGERMVTAEELDRLGREIKAKQTFLVSALTGDNVRSAHLKGTSSSLAFFYVDFKFLQIS